MKPIDDDSMFNGFHGKFGNMVFRQMNGKTYISSAPRKSRLPRSDKQLKAQNRFQRAVMYAKAILADPEARAALAARLEPGQTVYTLAIRDFYEMYPLK